MLWLLEKLAKGIGLLLALHFGAFFAIMALFMLVATLKETPKQFAELWRERADATVIALGEQCTIREAPSADLRGRTTRGISRVPCENLEAELASRPAGARLQFREKIGRIVFTTSGGAEIGVDLPRWKLEGSGAVTVGHRMTVSYDPAAPAATVHIPPKLLSYLISMAIMIGLAVLVIAAIRWWMLRELARTGPRPRNRWVTQPAASPTYVRRR